MTVDELDGPAGSVGQVRESRAPADGAGQGRRASRVVLVGHVTKDGSLAGPKTLEHLVDAVIDLEGERVRRVCASCAPRRTGSARPRSSASSRWASPVCARSPTRPGRSSPSTTGRRPGSVVAPTLEGTRPLLVEVQALVAPTGYATPRADAPAGSTRTGSRCSSPSSAGGPASASAATTSTPTSPAASPSPSRRSTCRSPSRSPRRCATVRSTPARSPSARSVCSASCGRSSGLERRLREAARLGFDRAIVPRPARCARPGRRRASTSRVATLVTRSAALREARRSASLRR